MSIPEEESPLLTLSLQDNGNSSVNYHTANNDGTKIETYDVSTSNTKIDNIWNNNPIQVYKRRWYILFISSLVAFLQCYLTNTWPVIAVSISPIFGWSNAQISLMQTWYCAMFLLLIFPVCWLIETKGLRLPMILTAGAMFLAAILRCTSLSPPAVTWLNNVGNALLGAAQPLTYIQGPVISAIWFPPKERVTCTSILVTVGYLGYAACFLIDLNIIKSEILHGRIIECVICGVTFLAVLAYFPSKPPKPPSQSSALPKLNFFHGIKSLFKISYSNFWLICLTSEITAAMYSTWLSLITINFGNFLTQAESGYLGCLANVIGPLAAVIFGRVGDLCLGKRKLVTMFLVCLAVFTTYWVLLIAMNYIPQSKIQLYIAMILQGIAIIGPAGLMFEMAVETNYPVDEIVTSGAIMITYNVFPFVFLLVFLIPNIGTSWMNWFVYISFIICVPLVYFFKERYNRMSLDRRDSLIIAVGDRIQQPIISTVD